MKIHPESTLWTTDVILPRTKGQWPWGKSGHMPILPPEPRWPFRETRLQWVLWTLEKLKWTHSIDSSSKRHAGTSISENDWGQGRRRRGIEGVLTPALLKTGVVDPPDSRMKWPKSGTHPPFLRVRGGIISAIFRKIVGQIRWIFGFWCGLP